MLGGVPLNLDNAITNDQAVSSDPMPIVMTVAQVAAALGVSRPTAYNLVNRKDFPSFRIGKKILIAKKKLMEWIDNQCAMEA